jgi:hypothetical protein
MSLSRSRRPRRAPRRPRLRAEGEHAIDLSSRVMRERENRTSAAGLFPRHAQREQRRRGSERSAANRRCPRRPRLPRDPAARGAPPRDSLEETADVLGTRGAPAPIARVPGILVEDPALERSRSRPIAGTSADSLLGRASRRRRTRRSPACSRFPRAASAPVLRRACGERVRLPADVQSARRPWDRASCAQTPTTSRLPRPRRPREASDHLNRVRVEERPAPPRLAAISATG